MYLHYLCFCYINPEKQIFTQIIQNDKVQYAKTDTLNSSDLRITANTVYLRTFHVCLLTCWCKIIYV